MRICSLNYPHFYYGSITFYCIRFFVHKVVEVLFWLQISAQSNYKSNAAEQVVKRLFLDLIFLVLLNLNKYCRLRLYIMQIDI